MSRSTSRQPTAPLIVCFGDSLTSGYQSPTVDSPQIRETPYGAFLQEHLGEQARIRVSGICGELTGEMAGRFRDDALAHGPAAVVILGGTNDLGCGAHPAEIFRNLLKMYELAFGARVQPVAVTVPSIRLEGDGADEWAAEHIARRHALNRLIQEYGTRRSMPVADLFAATSEPITGQLQARYSNDGLHLTTEGYRRLADLLYETVFRHEGWGGRLRPMLRAVTDRDFDGVVGRAGVPVLVEFWQPGCGHCQALMRVLEQVEKEASERLLVLTMNVQEEHQIPAELEITSLPALALYRNGRFERFIGGLGKKEEILRQVARTPAG